MRTPPATRLMAECITEADHVAAVEEHGEAWPDFVRYTEKAFPDTAAGLERAAAWVRRHAMWSEGRVEREELRPEWRGLKKAYWYDHTYDVYHVGEEGGEWEYAEEGD